MPFLPDLMVETRDGVRLATDVTLPEGPGPFPVILERTPYGKHLASRSEIDVGMSTPRTRAAMASRFAAHGYAVVTQDCRGRHGSEGVFAKYVSDADDGYDACAWIVAQPWCDGRIGTYGLSYAAHTQMALACAGAPGLATMILDSGGFSNAMTCGIRQGGAFELKQATWAYRQALESPAAKADPALKAALEAEDIFAWFRRMPWSEGNSPVRHVPEYESYLLDQWRRGTFDEGWAKAGLWSLGFADAIPDIPVLLMSSWLDVYVRTTFENLEMLSRPPRRAPVHLIMGPWTHGDRTKRVFGAADFGPSAPLEGIDGATWFDLRLAWFERHLKGRSDVAAPPKARVFVMGGGTGAVTGGVRDIGGTWVETPSWPPPGVVETAFHLSADGALSAAPARPGTRPFVSDPAHPVPTIGGALTSGAPVFEGGMHDQVEGPAFFGCDHPGRPLAARADVAVFETAPLEDDVTLAGPVVARLFVSVDAPDADVTVKLVDVHPDGAAFGITDGILRLRFREGTDAERPLVPGAVVEAVVEPFATAMLFKRGHRIRLDVAGSNFPKFDVNPQTGGALGMPGAKRVATITLHCGPATPSRVLLPVWGG
jgi:hypothetical protein